MKSTNSKKHLSPEESEALEKFLSASKISKAKLTRILLQNFSHSLLEHENRLIWPPEFNHFPETEIIHSFQSTNIRKHKPSAPIPFKKPLTKKGDNN
jgi:hypothetical protein